jgi:hypothetical protein
MYQYKLIILLVIVIFSFSFSRVNILNTSFVYLFEVFIKYVLDIFRFKQFDEVFNMLCKLVKISLFFFLNNCQVINKYVVMNR